MICTAVKPSRLLVLHGPHVEVVHSHDVEQVQVVLKTKGLRPNGGKDV
jgi:hypothetical protein